MKTRPTNAYASFDSAAGDAQARVVNTSRRIRALEALVRNGLLTTVDRAMIARLKEAQQELEGLKTNTSAIEGALGEMKELYAAATTPESREDQVDFSRDEKGTTP